MESLELMASREARELSAALQFRCLQLRAEAHIAIVESKKIIEQSRRLLEVSRTSRRCGARTAIAGGQIGDTFESGEQKRRRKKRRKGVGLGVEGLTTRESEILRLIAGSQSTKQIAASLGISFRTAVNHRTHIMSKLGIHDVAGLTRFAIAAGLISVEGELMRSPHLVPAAGK